MQGPKVRSIVVGCLAWLVACTAGGLAAVAHLGDYGSIVQLLIGVLMGVLGAASHLVLSFSTRFRRLGFLKRGLLNWLCAYLPLVAIAALLVNHELAASDSDFWPETAKLLLLYIGTPMLCLALVISLITSTRASQLGPKGTDGAAS
jgi:hypothetical protein